MYLNDFNSKEDVIREFAIESSLLDDCNILVASYTYEGYEGDAFVIFKKGDLLYEVNSGHCSCNGLEGTWDPEETSWDAILMRNTHGRHGEMFEQLLLAMANGLHPNQSLLHPSPLVRAYGAYQMLQRKI